MFSSWSFRKRLIFIWLSVQLIITVPTALFAIKSATNFIEKDIIFQSEQIRPVLNSALVTPLIQRDFASIIAILKELVVSDNIEKIIIRDSNENLIAQEPRESNQKNRADISPLTIEFPIQADGIKLGTATVGISRARLIETRSNIIFYASFIGLISILFFYFFALLISRYVTKPISELVIVAENISKGNYKIPVFSNRKDEIGVLQNAFQLMSAEIAKRINDLRDLNIDLEKRVHIRTESLRVATEDLAQKVDELKLLGSVVDRSHFGVSIADLKLPDMPIIYVNSAFTKVTGYKAEEVIGRQYHIFQDSIADPDTVNQINTALKNKTACTVDFLDKHRNGEAFWNRLSLFPVVIDGSDPRYYVFFQNDISALKRVSAEREVLLQEIQENRRLQSLGVLVAGLAHEINNPLGIAITATTHISDSAANIRKNITNLKDEELIHFLEDEEDAFKLIFDNLHRASDLVRGFKDIARDRSLDDKKEINLLSYLKSIEQTFTPVLKNARCKLSLDIDPNISLKVSTGSLGQIITNLVLNATIHAFKGVSDPQIQIIGSQTDQSIILKISDNGNGIAPTALPNLFTPFYTTSRNTGATGLGLYISRQIAADVFGGSLSAQNKPDKGCEFTLQIPKE